MTVGLIPDQVLATINGIELLGIVYLAIAVSNLRASLARVEGKLEEQNHVRDREANK